MGRLLQMFMYQIRNVLICTDAALACVQWPTLFLSDDCMELGPSEKSSEVFMEKYVIGIHSYVIMQSYFLLWKNMY